MFAIINYVLTYQTNVLLGSLFRHLFSVKILESTLSKWLLIYWDLSFLLVSQKVVVVGNAF